jgi:hypothetical protein
MLSKAGRAAKKPPLARWESRIPRLEQLRSAPQLSCDRNFCTSAVGLKRPVGSQWQLVVLSTFERLSAP